MLVALTKETVLAALFVLGTSIFLRSILSFFVSEDSAFYAFCCVLSEPIVAPVRRLLDRTALAEALPIDLSGMVAYLLIILLQSFLLSFS